MIISILAAAQLAAPAVHSKSGGNAPMWLVVPFVVVIVAGVVLLRFLRRR